MYDHEEQQGDRQRTSSSGMATASMVLGILALISGCCIYLSLPLGALGILFALLSKGYEKTFPPASKSGLLISILSVTIVLVMNIIILAMNWNFIINLAGSESFQQELEEIMDYYYGEGALSYPEELDLESSLSDGVSYGYAASVTASFQPLF